MLELAVQLSNPFGDDEVDFPVQDWLAETTYCAFAMLENKGPGSHDDWKQAVFDE